MQQVYKHLLLFFFVLAMPCITWAKKEVKYPVSAIAPELLKNANAVVRLEESTYELLSLNHATYKEKMAITILKENAIEESYFSVMYDKLSHVSNIEGTIYDAKGIKVRRIKHEDILDFSAIKGFSLYEDNRVKYIDPRYMTVPFTIEYTYEKDYKTTFYIPGWYAFNGYNISLEKSSYTVIVPEDYEFRYRERNLKTAGTQLQKEGKTIYKWEINNMKAPVNESFSPPLDEKVPCMLAAPSDFEIDNYRSKLNTWSDFGRFIGALIEGRDKLPEETQQEILTIASQASDTYDKISRIYQYAQKKNRYISVQIGIGGFQPFDAETVDRLSYGDCKALTNYTKALLNIAGIKSFYTLVYAGTSPNKLDTDFAANRFNHAILCVPLEKDTIWLECTNPYSPCGYIGDFTDDRYALVVKEKEGELVRTPQYGPNDNLQTLVGEVTFNADGSANATANFNYNGSLYGDEVRLILKDQKDQRKAIIKSIDVPDFTLVDYKLTDHKQRKPIFEKTLTIETPHYFTQMGNRYMAKLNMFNAFDQVPRYDRNRENEVLIRRYYTEQDTLTFTLPQGIKAEGLPEPVEIDTPYGTYKASATVQGNKIKYIRFFRINKGRYPAAEFNDLRDFLEKVSVADNAKCVLMKES
ncbi:DUF3857 domain-containing protein [Marinilabiliaceae bacterium JC017]|nr:DUF3857 domain-containing protein [Marinilabiliaceae bacterium JC017]